MKEYLFHFFFIIYSILIYRYRDKISTKLKLMDFPDNSRKSHSSPVASAGGLIIFPYITCALIYLSFLSFIKLKILFIWIFLYLTFFLTGIIDDKIHLNAKSKTFILLLILFIILPLDSSLVVNILDFKDIKYVIVLNQGALFFTIFCVYLFYNSLNFSDGLNGISLTVCLYFVIVIILTQNELNVFHYSILISIFITLIPNLFGKIFIGNSGISFLACALFLLFIDSYNNNFLLFDEIMLIVFLPTVDAGRVTIERIINGESPFKSDKNHFHHLLIKIFKKEYVFLPYLIFAMLPYLATKVNVTTYTSLIIFSALYFLTLIFLKRKNA